MKTDQTLARTQIYLTHVQQKRLENASRRTGGSKSELIRRAVDQFLDSQPANTTGAKVQRLQNIKGLWSDRTNMADPSNYVSMLRKPRF
ncbi:MAG: ribbon-helix-helix domain-containing protein [Polaromonas sp.]|uniref:ribbon-helix-helix domain-containing protein n=1 Tax=Polaromonas sp. TaxID=1869339 RepID=UPI0025CF413E|nr:CopG family transcriptional regulator [Polaromonas sp.]MBI2727863.1 ribbon-helix-helix domain-containing protein [Polaromonas sp.]